MKSKKIGGGYIVRLEKGEEIIEALTKFCAHNGVKSGVITGIGGTDDVDLNYYNLEKGEYVSKKFAGENYEIISLNGNVSVVEDKPFIHAHILLGDSNYNAFGGHLKSATVAITCEITIGMADGVINRKFDDEFKLNLLDL